MLHFLSDFELNVKLATGFVDPGGFAVWDLLLVACRVIPVGKSLLRETFLEGDYERFATNEIDFAIEIHFQQCGEVSSWNVAFCGGVGIEFQYHKVVRRAEVVALCDSGQKNESNKD